MSEITDNKDINYQVMMGSYTVEEFVKQIDDAYNNKGEETKKGILIAPFQRTYQWHQEEHPLYFLDSLNSNIFVMPVILVEHKQQTWIIDGQQRLATLYCYIKGYQPKDNKPIEWKKLIMAIKNKNMHIVKPCEWKKLDDGQIFDIEKIKQTPIGYSFLFNVNHKDYPELLVKIFDRINNQGKPLNLEETINAYQFLEKDKLKQPLTEFMNAIISHARLHIYIEVLDTIVQFMYINNLSNNYQNHNNYWNNNSVQNNEILSFIKQILLGEFVVNTPKLLYSLQKIRQVEIDCQYTSYDELPCYQDEIESYNEDDYESRDNCVREAKSIIDNCNLYVQLPTLYLFYNNQIAENHCIFKNILDITKYIEQVSEIEIDSSISFNKLLELFQQYVLEVQDE